MNLNDLFNEEKVRLDPKCWTGKKIGNPKTKMKGGVRVNNCVPAESVEEAKVATSQDDRNFRDQADYGGEDPDARDQYGNLKRSTSPGLGGTINIGGVDIPFDAVDAGLGSVAAMGSLGGLRNIGGMKGIFGKSRDLGTTSQDMATQRNVGGNAIPSLGQSGKVVTSPAADRALTKLGGKDVSTTSGPTSKSGSTNVQLDPVADVPAYVRQGKSDPITTPVNKPKISIKPGETMDQAVQRTKAEQEFGKFLQGQSGQTFGAGAGRGTVNPEPTKQQRFPELKTDTQVKWDNYKKQTGRDHIDKIEHDDKMAVDAMVKQARQNAADRDAKNKNKSDSIQPVPAKWKNRDTDVDLEEQSRKKREPPEVNYDDEYDAMVARVKKLAGLGPMKTVYDPNKRQYRNMPTAVQPKK